MGENMSPADLAAVVDNNRGYAYPPYAYNGGFGNGFGNGDWSWILLLVLLSGGFGYGGFGGFGGFGGGFGGMYEFPWLLTGQQNINANTNNGFDTLHLSNQIEGVRDGVAGLSNQLCSCCGDITNAINTTAYNAEIAAANRQMANMNQNFDNQIATLQGFNNLNNALQQCCCDNRLATCQTQNVIQSEGNATRFADANNTRDIIESSNRNSQAILDKLCQLELDNVKAQLEAKNDLIDQLRQENLYARGQASQVAQTAELRTSQATIANQAIAELRSCPIPAQPVYGNTPIFSCNGNNGCGCGCTGNF